MRKEAAASPPAAQYRTRELAAHIERDINQGRLGAGAWLKQVDLEQSYGYSRLDVRQALERLAERRLVERIPNRGFRVGTFDARRLDNILNIRAALEVAAGETLVGKIERVGLDRMTRFARQFSDALADGTVVEQEAANRAFHAEMLRHCLNRDLVEMIFDLRDRVPLSVRRENSTAVMLAKSAQDHFDMINHLRKKDLPALSAVIRRHVLGGLGARTHTGD